MKVEADKIPQLNRWTRKFNSPYEKEYWESEFPIIDKNFLLGCIIGLIASPALFGLGVLFQGYENVAPIAKLEVLILVFVFGLGLIVRKTKIYTRMVSTLIVLGVSIIFLALIILMNQGNPFGKEAAEVATSIIILTFPFLPKSFWYKTVLTFLLITVFVLAMISNGSTIQWGTTYSVAFFTILTLISLAHDFANRRNFILNKTIEIQKEKMEKLLRNIYPEPVFQKVRDMAEPSFVQRYEDVSVMFVDIVGFTKFAADKRPEEVVNILDELFSRIDASCKKSGVLKIKTIGDAYLAVAGMSDNPIDHTLNISDLAFEVREAVHKYSHLNSLDLKVRIGLHSGPVVAGIIGKETSHFDLWGSTVNFAARLESSGQAGEIQVSQEFADRLGGRYELEDRGEIELKGIGKVKALFLTRPVVS